MNSSLESNEENNKNMFVWRYQPILFDDYQKTDDTFELLKLFIQLDKINILLIGNNSVGKTSILNSIISEYYKGIDTRAWNDNVLFVNSLKDQGVTFYRNEVRIFCQTKSLIPNKLKIIVIDDIDSIHENSQQLLRIAMDKYSNNIHFICSCSSNQKVIPCLQSRLHLLRLAPLEPTFILNVINRICLDEHLEIDEETKKYLVSVSDSKIKIIVHYLEKFKLLRNPINIQLAKEVCHNISFSVLENYHTHLRKNNIGAAISVLRDLYNIGYSVLDILDSYYLFVKFTDTLSDVEKYKLVPVVCKYITIFNTVHENEMELVFFTNNIKTTFT